jgi:hypothetical protein
VYYRAGATRRGGAEHALVPGVAGFRKAVDSDLDDVRGVKRGRQRRGPLQALAAVTALHLYCQHPSRNTEGRSPAAFRSMSPRRDAGASAAREKGGF